MEFDNPIPPPEEAIITKSPQDIKYAEAINKYTENRNKLDRIKNPYEYISNIYPPHIYKLTSNLEDILNDPSKTKNDGVKEHMDGGSISTRIPIWDSNKLKAKLNDSIANLQKDRSNPDKIKNYLYYAVASELIRINKILMNINLDINVKIMSLLSQEKYAKILLNDINDNNTDKIMNLYFNCLYIKIENTYEDDFKQFDIFSIFGDAFKNQESEAKKITSQLKQCWKRDTDHYRNLLSYKLNNEDIKINGKYMISYVFFKILFKTFFKNGKMNTRGSLKYMGSAQDGSNLFSILNFIHKIEEKTMIILNICAYYKQNGLDKNIIDPLFLAFIEENKKVFTIAKRRHDNAELDVSHPYFTTNIIKTDQQLKYINIAYKNVFSNKSLFCFYDNASKSQFYFMQQKEIISKKLKEIGTNFKIKKGTKDDFDKRYEEAKTPLAKKRLLNTINELNTEISEIVKEQAKIKKQLDLVTASASKSPYSTLNIQHEKKGFITTKNGEQYLESDEDTDIPSISQKKKPKGGYKDQTAILPKDPTIPYYFNFNVNNRGNKISTLFDRTPNEFYKFGPFDLVFNDTNVGNDKVQSEVKTSLDKDLLEDDKDIIIIGYGQSGSGKTTTLIQFNRANQVPEDGVLALYLKSIKTELTNINIECVNLYYEKNLNTDGTKKDIASYNDFDPVNNYKTEIYHWENNKNYYGHGGQTIDLLSGLIRKEEYYINNQEHFTKKMQSSDINGVCEKILELFSARQINPTSNNEKSSRSHIIVCLTLEFSNGKERKLIVCDLAGVENEFDCANSREILKFDSQYETLRKAAFRENNPDKEALVAYTQLFGDDNKEGMNIDGTELGRNSKNTIEKEFTKYDKSILDRIINEDSKEDKLTKFSKEVGKAALKYNKGLIKKEFLQKKSFYANKGNIITKWIIFFYISIIFKSVAIDDEQHKQDIDRYLGHIKKLKEIQSNLVGIFNKNINNETLKITNEQVEKHLNNIYNNFNELNDLINNDDFTFNNKFFNDISIESCFEKKDNEEYIKELFTQLDKFKFDADIQDNNKDHIGPIKSFHIEDLPPILESDDVSVHLNLEDPFKFKISRSHNPAILSYAPLSKDTYSSIYNNYFSNNGVNKYSLFLLLKVYKAILDEKIVDKEEKEEEYEKKKEDVEYAIKNILKDTKSLKNYFSNSLDKSVIENLLNNINLSPEPGSKLESDIPDSNLKLDQRIAFIKKQCAIRKQEGYMINRSLYELNKGMALISKESVSNGKLPIYFEKYIYPDSRTDYLDNYTLDKYYDKNNYNTKDPAWKTDLNKYGVILTICKQYFGVENFLQKFKLYTLLVYNTSFFGQPKQSGYGNNNSSDEEKSRLFYTEPTSDNVGYKNNPSSPPYVNLDILKYFTRINLNNLEVSISVIKNQLVIINKYPFYEKLLKSYNNESINKLYDEKHLNKMKQSAEIESVLKGTEDLIELIEKNNATTLIGTFENTDSLQTISFNDIGSSNLSSRKMANDKYNANVPKEKQDNILYFIKAKNNIKSDILTTTFNSFENFKIGNKGRVFEEDWLKNIFRLDNNDFNKEIKEFIPEFQHNIGKRVEYMNNEDEETYGIILDRYRIGQNNFYTIQNSKGIDENIPETFNEDEPDEETYGITSKADPNDENIEFIPNSLKTKTQKAIEQSILNREQKASEYAEKAAKAKERGITAKRRAEIAQTKLAQEREENGKNERTPHPPKDNKSRGFTRRAARRGGKGKKIKSRTLKKYKAKN